MNNHTTKIKPGYHRLETDHEVIERLTEECIKRGGDCYCSGLSRYMGEKLDAQIDKLGKARRLLFICD